MKTNTITIGLVTGPLFSEWLLFDAFMIMSQNLSEHGGRTWELDGDPIPPFIMTDPLKFRFSNKNVTLWKERGKLDIYLEMHLLPDSPIFKGPLIQCDGVIIILHNKRLSIDYLQTRPRDSMLSNFDGFLELVYKLNVPTVFALHDVQDLFPPIQIGAFPYDDIAPLKEHRWIDVWDLSSPGIQILKEEFNIPESALLLPYSYRKPITIENILKTLIAEIEK
jgi:hypothetical protein